MENIIEGKHTKNQRKKTQTSANIKFSLAIISTGESKHQRHQAQHIEILRTSQHEREDRREERHEAKRQFFFRIQANEKVLEDRELSRVERKSGRETGENHRKDDREESRRVGVGKRRRQIESQRFVA